MHLRNRSLKQSLCFLSALSVGFKANRSYNDRLSPCIQAGEGMDVCTALFWWRSKWANWNQNDMSFILDFERVG